MSPYKMEVARFNRRLATITDPEMKKELKKFRRDVNKREYMELRGAYSIRRQIRPSNSEGRTRFVLVASDEMACLHNFLDNRGISKEYQQTSPQWSVQR